MASSFSASYETKSPELEDYKASTLKSYEAQTDKVNDAYDASLGSDLASLKSSYDTSVLDAQADLDKIPKTYEAQAKSLYNTTEANRQNFNEYAAGSGLNVGASSQAKLAMNTQLSNELATIRASEASAISDAQLNLTKLKTSYEDAISEASRKNEADRALALMQEYQKQAQSIVSTAQAQADENYRAYQSALSNQEYRAEWTKEQEEQKRSDAQDVIDQMLSAGASASYIAANMPDELSASGYTTPYLASMANYYAKKAASSSYSSGYSSSRSSGSSSGSSARSGSSYNPVSTTSTASQVKSDLARLMSAVGEQKNQNLFNSKLKNAIAKSGYSSAYKTQLLKAAGLA